MGRDGSNPNQLTRGNTDSNWPDCTPDSKWVVYQHSEASGQATVWKVPIDGGVAQQVTNLSTMRADVSPDATMIASWKENEQPNLPKQIALFPLTGSQLYKSLDVTPTAVVGWDAALQWAPSGQALTYIDQRGNIGNIWSQPINGGPPKQLTEFKDSEIFSFAWSAKSRLATSRGVRTGDALLIKDSP